MLSTHQVDADGCAGSRSICDNSRGSSHPRAPEFNVEWRGVLRSERHAPCRVRVRELRGRTRNHASASKWSMDQMVGCVLETIELKAREAWLGWHKILLKISGVFK
jgi:hypothetical protein